MVFVFLKPQQLTHPRNEILLQSKIKMWISNIAHDSSGTLKVQMFECLGNSNTKGSKQNSHTRIRSPMSEDGEPLFYTITYV